MSVSSPLLSVHLYVRSHSVSILSLHLFSFTQLSSDLGMNIRPKQSLTFAKCLEMGLQNHVEEISKVGEVAGKEYAIEQVSGWGVQVKLPIFVVLTMTGSCDYSMEMCAHAFRYVILLWWYSV